LKTFSKTVHKFYFVVLISFLFFSCTYKAPIRDPYFILLEEGLSGKILKGKVFFQGESFFLKNNLSGGAYGDFIVSSDFLYLTLKPPFSSEVLITWQKGEKFVKIVNFDKKKIYRILLEGADKIDFPQYFLGLKEKRLSIKRGLLEGEYKFSPEEKEGEFASNLLNLRWKIKEIHFSSERISLPDFKEFKEKELRLSF